MSIVSLPPAMTAALSSYALRRGLRPEFVLAEAVRAGMVQRFGLANIGVDEPVAAAVIAPGSTRLRQHTPRPAGAVGVLASGDTPAPAPTAKPPYERATPRASWDGRDWPQPAAEAAGARPVSDADAGAAVPYLPEVVNAQERAADIAAGRQPRARVVRGNGWTAARMKQFLEALAAGGSVTKACATVGMSPSTAYRLRARPELRAFRNAWDAAVALSVHMLVDSAWERAVHGEEQPVFQGGVQVGTRVRHDNRMTMFLLRMRGLKEDSLVPTVETDDTVREVKPSMAPGMWRAALGDFDAAAGEWDDAGDAVRRDLCDPRRGQATMKSRKAP